MSRTKSWGSAPNPASFRSAADRHESWTPGSIVTQHGIADSQKFVHDCHQRLLCAFAALAQALVKGLKRWVDANGGQSAHVKHIAYGLSTAADVPGQITRARLTIHRRHTCQGGDLLVAQLSQF